jgi:hypothetical protein
MRMGKASNQLLFGDHLSLLNPQRLLVLLLVVLGHGLLIYLLTLHSNASRTESTDEFRSVAIYLAPIVELEQGAPRKNSVVEATPTNRQKHKESTAIALPVPQAVPSADIAQPDWAMEAEEAAQRIANSVAPRRGFGKPSEDNVATDKPPVGIFERGSPHRAGDIEMIGPGIERRWLNENCFQEFGHLPELFPAPGLRVNTVRCLVGRAADGTLFEHLKPGYLKQK